MKRKHVDVEESRTLRYRPESKEIFTEGKSEQEEDEPDETTKDVKGGIIPIEVIYSNIMKGISPVFERKTPTTAWRELSVFAEAIPELPYELLTLIHQAVPEEELGTPREFCYRDTHDGAYEDCVEELKQIPEHRHSDTLLAEKFICGWYCLLKNLPTHMVYKRTKSLIFSEDKVVPFKVELTISSREISLLTVNLWYDEEKKQHLANINLYDRHNYSPTKYPISIADLTDLLIELASYSLITVQARTLLESDLDFEFQRYVGSKGADLWNMAGRKLKSFGRVRR